MGSKEYKSEQPVHPVTVPSFYMGKFTVTDYVYKSVLSKGETGLLVDNRPVTEVSWNGVHEFIDILNAETGKSFRLPSEAEWEYAALGGKYSQGYSYCGSDKLKQVGWYDQNSGGETKEVGLLLPNELGIYDMSGNVWEWCEDDYHGNYKGSPNDGSPWIDSSEKGDDRVLRGGSCFNNADRCRPAVRSRDSPGRRGNGLGFRLVLSLQFTP